MANSKPSSPSIAELEALLDAEQEQQRIEIMPDGSVRHVASGRPLKGGKPLTMRQRLGGEYAA